MVDGRFDGRCILTGVHKPTLMNHREEVPATRLEVPSQRGGEPDTLTKIARDDKAERPGMAGDSDPLMGQDCPQGMIPSGKLT
jgi:hypothetical protein